MKVIGQKYNSAYVIYSFAPHMEAVETVVPGEVFKVRTMDCFSGQLVSETATTLDLKVPGVNPATGPVLVSGAEPGDLLRVAILGIDVVSPGVAIIAPGAGALGAKVTRRVTRLIDIIDGLCHFAGVTIPARPMIGVIGVAPSDDDGECRNSVPWKHGGNMDTTDVAEGSTVYLPVRQPGALLAMGDCHAAMGDGEVGLSGCEVAAEVTVRADVVRGKAVTWPLVETGEHTMVVASGDSLDEAAAAATDQAVMHLSSGLGLPWEDAYILASLAVDLRISQVVNPKKTVRASIPKWLLPTDVLIMSMSQ